MAENYTELIAHYIRIGEWNRLDELDSQALPILQQYAVSEQDEDVRAILVEAVWQYRRPESIPFLAQMLNDPSKNVWKAAIDGLVTLGTDDALLALKTAKASASAKQFEYIDEAIDQLENPEAWPGIK
jgi:HEAT repeat protein